MERVPIPPPSQSHGGTQEHQHCGSVQEISEQEAAWEPSLSGTNKQELKNNCCLTQSDIFITRETDLFPRKIFKGKERKSSLKLMLWRAAELGID